MLLCRLAENAFWLGRYLERAEDLARAIRAYEDIRLDIPGQRAAGWQRLAALAEADPDEAAYLEPTVFVARVILDRQNPSSLLGALHAGRENLRRARSLLPSDCWHILNPLYLRVGALDVAVPPAELRAILDQVLASSRELAGHVAAGMLRNASYAFLRIGAHLERADMTLRIATIMADTLMPAQPPFAFEDVRWMGLLRSVGALGTYRHRYHARMDFGSTLELLVSEPTFPRSFEYGLLKIGHCLGGLPGNAAALAAVQACRPMRVVNTRAALDDFAPDALARLAFLSSTLETSYFARTPSSPDDASPPRAHPSRVGAAAADHRESREPAEARP